VVVRKPVYRHKKKPEFFDGIGFRPGKQLYPDRNAAIYTARKAGMSFDEIAESLGMTTKDVRSLFRSHERRLSCDTRSHDLAVVRHRRNKRIERLFLRHHYTMAQISKKMNVSLWTVTAALRHMRRAFL